MFEDPGERKQEVGAFAAQALGRKFKSPESPGKAGLCHTYKSQKNCRGLLIANVTNSRFRFSERLSHVNRGGS